MHLLAATPGVVSDGSEAVDLGQTPGDIVVLSAADTELAALAAAQSRAGTGRLLCGSPISCSLNIPCRSTFMSRPS